MKYQEWLNGCGCCPDIQDCPPSTGNPCDCDSILLELSKQHTDDLVLQDEIDNLDEKKLDASAYTPDEYATEEWVNEQGFLKTVEPLKTINGESLIGEGDIVISGGSGDAYTKAETDALLDEKQNALNAGDYITIDSANTISTSGLVTVVDNEVEEYPFITKKEDTPEGANFNAASYDDAADTFELIITGTTFGAYDVNNCFFVFINESGETTPKINGFYMFNTESYVYPTRIQEYVNLDLYEYHTTDRYNLHIKYSGKNGWRLKQFFIYLLTDYNEGVGYIAYQNYSAIQSADAISENVYPALEKLTANKFDKDFTCNDPLLYESAFKRFRIKTSNQDNDTISASTSATTNLARSYDVKTYVSGFTYDKDTIDNKIASGGTFDPTLYYKKSETSGKTEIQNALDLKLDASAFTESDYYKKSETSGKTELDAEFDKYYKKSETSSKTEIDDALLLDAYEYYKIKNTYTDAFPSLTGTADWNTAIQGGIKVRNTASFDSSYGMSFKLQVIDENGNTFSASTGEVNGTAIMPNTVNPLPDYIDVVDAKYVDIPYHCMSFWMYMPKDGYRISYAQIDNYWDGMFTSHNKITEMELYEAFPSGYTKDIIEDYIEPQLANAQEKLTFESNVLLNSYDEKLVPYVPTDSSIGRWTSGSTSPVQTQAVYNYTYSKAQIDEKIASGGSITSGDVQTMIDESISVKTNNSDFSAHTANTAIHLTSGDIQTQIGNSISGKADSADVYTKAETDSKLADKQDKLTAGTGIDITNNVISVTGGGVSYSAGTGIDITNNVISSTLNAYNGTGVGSLIIGQSANTASGDYSVAVGAQTEALGGRSFAQGLSGKTTNTAEITFGQLNDTKNAYAGFGHSGNTLFTVGNGAGIDGSTTDYARHNAFEVRSNGDIYIPEPSKVNPSHYYQAPMIKLQDRLNEIDNKPNIWCGSESQWSQISGSTESGTLYLIY